ncbi:hypothetical protein Hdeb2414_s0005g00166931 [Helianthus debilis subsp. tardiflorus]
MVFIMHFYGFHISQMSPAGMVRVRHFEYLCRSQGMEPTVEKFRAFYQLIRNIGFYSFGNRGAAKKILISPPKSFHNWKMKFFFIREEVMPIAIIFRESDKIEKEELPIPKGDDWYMRLLATPNRIFDEQVLVAATVSDKWPERSEDVPILMFNGEGRSQAGDRKRTREEDAAGCNPIEKTTVVPSIGKESWLRSLYKFSPEALKKALEKVREPEPEKPKEPTPKKTKFVIIPPKPNEKEVEKTVEKPTGDVIPEKEKVKETETAATTKQDKAQGLEVVHITRLDQPMKSKGPDVTEPVTATQHDVPTQTVQVTTAAGGSAAQFQAQVAHRDASATGANAGGSGAGGQKGDVKKTSRPRSPIGAEDTLGDIYYKSYTEEQRGEAPHQPVWSLKQKDTFVEFGACWDWFLGSFPPGEVNRKRVRNHEDLYRAYVIREANARSSNHQIVHEWRTMYKERASWEKYRIW